MEPKFPSLNDILYASIQIPKEDLAYQISGGKPNLGRIVSVNRWIMSIQFNGELISQEQEAMLKLIAGAPTLANELIEYKSMLYQATQDYQKELNKANRFRRILQLAGIGFAEEVENLPPKEEA